MLSDISAGRPLHGATSKEDPLPEAEVSVQARLSALTASLDALCAIGKRASDAPPQGRRELTELLDVLARAFDAYRAALEGALMAKLPRDGRYARLLRQHVRRGLERERRAIEELAARSDQIGDAGELLAAAWALALAMRVEVQDLTRDVRALGAESV